MGRLRQLPDVKKGAGANGYIFGFDPVCNYALRSYSSSYQR